MRNEELMKKWAPILEHNALPAISDSHREAVTATLLENTEASIREGSSLGGTGVLSETNTTGISMTGDVSTDRGAYDPVLISLVRRSMPNLVAYDIVGVQPMTGPTGLIFAMRSHTGATHSASTEALFGEANAGFSGDGTANQDSGGYYADGSGSGMTTAAAELKGTTQIANVDGTADTATPVTESNPIAEMSFRIDKVSVTAVSRALKAEYTSELAQDLKAIHGLDAETELANMLSAELLAEINREVVRKVYVAATPGAVAGEVASAGTFNLDVDSNGRWSVEKFKGLMFQIEKEANAIAKATRRGKGNIVICSSDVASALQMAGILDYTPALNNSLQVDDAGNTFAGVLNGRFKVYIDPYAQGQYLVVGYKGQNAFDAGIFYCPYVPLQMVRAVGENSFQSKIGFKTRYGLVANPMSVAAAANGISQDTGLTGSNNVYYRKVKVANLL
jgi:hypothetical protein